MDIILKDVTGIIQGTKCPNCKNKRLIPYENLDTIVKDGKIEEKPYFICCGCDHIFYGTLVNPEQK